ncbi:MAG: carboxylesterase family protein [Candidatus Marinimicrobia bacterium]|nr:carboxylesterase family protein [Candidatus Neomarinimicrobiota bacterium]
MKIIIYLLLANFLYPQSECDGNRFTDEIFNQVNVTSNVLYGGNYNPNVWGQNQWEDLYLDIYEPAGDDVEDRPLVFFLFGGSFVAGSKTNADIVELCTRYAKMGYVASAIDYRLTGDLIWSPNSETAYRATAKGMHDLKGAIRFFRMNDETSNDYRIDSDRIYAGGVSAGGIVAVNAAYLDLESEIPASLTDYIAENGGLEGNSGNDGYDSHFHGVINLCGAVGDYNWIVAGDIPIVNIHGDEDTVVPYGDGLITLFGLNMQVYGSYVINETMLSLGNSSDLYTFEGYDHNPFNESNNNMDITVEFTRDFMYDFVCSSEDSVLGDLNEDSVVNVQDIIIMVNIILGDEYNEAADLSGDGIINILDVIQLVNLILGE